MSKWFLQLIAVAMVAGLVAPKVAAQGNNFFGSSLPGSVPSAANPPAGSGGPGGSGGPPGGDYSDDEKRVQKKMKANVARYKELVNKGEAMMKKGESSHNDKMYKKGKILKEIGEKQLNEIQANSPVPDVKIPGDKK